MAKRRSDRARRDGGGGGARRAALGRPDAARRRELPGLRAHDAGAVPARARRREVGGGEGEPRARPPRRGASRRHRGCGRGRDGRRLRRRVPRRCLPDGLGHLDEHEHERGAREPRQRESRLGARREGARASERPRQHVPVVERRDPDDAPRRRGSGRAGSVDSRARLTLGGPAREGRSVGRRRQGRPHAPAGRDAHSRGAGLPGLRLAGGALVSAALPRLRRPPRGRSRRHGRRHGHRSRSRVPARRRSSTSRRGRTSRSVRRATTASSSPAARRRLLRGRNGIGGGRADEGGERRPLPRLGSALRSRRAEAPGSTAGLLDHAGQGEPGDERKPHPGVPARARIRHDGERLRDGRELRAERHPAAPRGRPPRRHRGARRRGGRFPRTLHPGPAGRSREHRVVRGAEPHAGDGARARRSATTAPRSSRRKPIARAARSPTWRPNSRSSRPTS